MSQEQGQTQDQQTDLQNAYPANEESGYNETQGGAVNGTGDTTQTEQSWRPSEEPAIEQAGGTTQATEDEPGRNQQDGRSQGSGEETVESQGQGAGSSGV